MSTLHLLKKKVILLHCKHMFHYLLEDSILVLSYCKRKVYYLIEYSSLVVLYNIVNTSSIIC